MDSLYFTFDSLFRELQLVRVTSFLLLKKSLIFFKGHGVKDQLNQAPHVLKSVAPIHLGRKDQLVEEVTAGDLPSSSRGELNSLPLSSMRASEKANWLLVWESSIQIACILFYFLERRKRVHARVGGGTKGEEERES